MQTPLPQGSGFILPTPQPQSRAADVQALAHAKSGAVLGIIGLVLSVIGSIVSLLIGGLSLGVTCNSQTSTCTAPSHPLALSAGLFGLEVVGLIVAILFILRFRSAFQALVPHDFRFRSPASLTILAVIGIVLLMVGLGLLLAAAGSVIGPCSSSGNYTNCNNAIAAAAGLLLGGVGLVVVAAILLLIGGIMLLVGIWRMGTRYNQSMIKVGAILLIIPFLDIVAPFLIYFGVADAERALAASGGFGGTTIGAFPPPPPPGAA